MPTVKVSTPMLNLGHCFLQHPYRCHVELTNDTDLPAKYELLPGSTADCLDSVLYSSPQPEVCVILLIHVAGRFCSSIAASQGDELPHSGPCCLCESFLLMGVSGWMFLLIPAHSGSPGQRAINQLGACR